MTLQLGLARPTGGAAADVVLPAYDRSRLVPSVVHIGVGGFHRAHQALYFDDLAQTGETGWGIVGVGLRRPQMGEVLRAKDGLFTVVERGPDRDVARVVGSVVRYLYARQDPEAVLRALADPRTRLVTLTITGEGYEVGPDADDGVRHDLAHPRVPTTMVGYLTEALHRRRAAGAGPFTVLSCDNLPDSGATARAAVLRFAALRDPDLAGWIDREVTFPSSMVDRITPETSSEVRDEVEARFGVADRWPVVTEPFRQWVVEDDFCAGRPPLDRVGVRFVDDVGPYKTVKARVLNAGHCALGHLGSLAGHTTSDGAMRDPVVRGVVERMLREEVLPLLPPVEGVDPHAYLDATLERFANPAIGDRLARLGRRGSVKMPAYLLPSLHEALEQGRPHGFLLLAVAGWLRYLRGDDLRGRPLEVEDPRLDQLRALGAGRGGDPRRVLGVRSVFGNLADRPVTAQRLGDLVRLLDRQGLAAAVAACAADDRALVA